MRTLTLAVIGAFSAQLVGISMASAQQQFNFRGQLTPQGQVNFNDPYRLTRPTLRYDIELDLTVRNGRIGGTARMRSGAEEASFPVEGKVKDLNCDFRAGNVMRFQGFCASEMLVGDAIIAGGQATAQLVGSATRGSWLAASAGLDAEVVEAPRLPEIRCQIPQLNLSQPQPELVHSQAEMAAASEAYRRDQTELAGRAARARIERDKALQAIELSGGELAQWYRTNLNWNRVVSRGSPAIGQMAQNRAVQLGQIENEPARVAGRAAIGPAIEAMRSVSDPAEIARLEAGARTIAAAFQQWEAAAKGLAEALPATAAGVNDALTLEAASPLARTCAASLGGLIDRPSGLADALASRGPALAPAVLASLNAATATTRSSLELQTRVGQLRQGTLFKDLPGIAPAFAKADARVTELSRLEAAERNRRVQLAAAAQAERRKRGLLTNDDVRDAVLAEIAAVEPNAELRGDAVVRTELGFPVMVYRPTVSGTTCSASGGTSSCSYELQMTQVFIGLPLTGMRESRRDTIVATPAGMRSPTYRQEMRERLARSQAAGPPKPSTPAWEPPQNLPFDILIQNASPF